MTLQRTTVAVDDVPQAWKAAVHEILGLESPFPSSENPSRPWENLLPALCARYGEAAGLGLGLRIGRAFARQMLPHLAEEPAFQAVDFRFLPWPRKMVTGLQHLAVLVSEWFGFPVQTEMTSQAVLWLPQGCPFGQHCLAHPCRCTPWEGFLQEVLYWMSGGRLFAVQTAAERPAALRIPQRPLH
jgi:hypothetical protein